MGSGRSPCPGGRRSCAVLFRCATGEWMPGRVFGKNAKHSPQCGSEHARPGSSVPTPQRERPSGISVLTKPLYAPAICSPSSASGKPSEFHPSLQQIMLGMTASFLQRLLIENTRESSGPQDQSTLTISSCSPENFSMIILKSFGSTRTGLIMFRLMNTRTQMESSLN